MAGKTFGDSIPRRMPLSGFPNARSIRNALDRARPHQANRLFAGNQTRQTKRDVMAIDGEDSLRTAFRATPSRKAARMGRRECIGARRRNAL